MSLIRQIEVGLEQGKVKAHLVRKALSDADINTRGLGYSMIAEDHLRALLVDYKPKAGDPVACYDYLVDCVQLDLDWDEDYALTREDALLELASTVDAREVQGSNMTSVAFWDLVGERVEKAGAMDAAARFKAFERSDLWAAVMQEWIELSA